MPRVGLFGARHDALLPLNSICLSINYEACAISCVHMFAVVE